MDKVVSSFDSGIVGTNVALAVSDVSEFEFPAGVVIASPELSIFEVSGCTCAVVA